MSGRAGHSWKTVEVSHRTAAEGHRVLIVAPYGRDADSVASVLTADGYHAAAYLDLATVAEAIGDDTGAVLLTQEALREDLTPLRLTLERQPAWSDIPFILLAAAHPGRGPSIDAIRRTLFEIATNAIVLERPLGSFSLISAVAAAMRSRQKQFEMRDRLAELSAGAQELSQRHKQLAQSQIALKESESRFKAITDSIDQMVWSAQPDGAHDYHNQRWYDFTGAEPGSTDGEAWARLVHPDDRERALEKWRQSLATGEPYHVEYRLRGRNGLYRWVLVRAQPMYDDDDDAITRWFGTSTDIQEIVEAREVINWSREELEKMVRERTAELERAHEIVRQSQKMEAVGKLTGGIAHDFNNMLTGILGALEIVRRRIASQRYDDLTRFMDAAVASAQRAAALTQRLLAFSRRQSLDAKPINVNALIGTVQVLLARSLGERISLRIRLSEHDPIGVTDANQLETAIINLAINARDAMPAGGALTIVTGQADLTDAKAAKAVGVAPGRYIIVEIADTGVGMAPEVLEKAFEPFFTTKPIGQGTGLGLSMVYGFVRQSNGHVQINSRPGQGTSVKLYLPAAGDGVKVAAEDGVQVAEALGHGETILVVEDDQSVRLLVREVLEELGYAAIEAAEAEAAIPILSSRRPIDLMISDVGLPDMNGRQLAEIARAHRPRLPILFVTGYAENAAIRAGFLGTNMSMITKPFAFGGLAAKVGEMLGRPNGAAN
jgi:PAS domain S-box-containing protein